MNNKIYFSLLSGVVYTIPEDYTNILDQYQIPLHKKPSDSCNNCYGRFYKSYNLTQKTFTPCNKCFNKCVDFSKIKEHIDIATPKQTKEIDFTTI